MKNGLAVTGASPAVQSTAQTASFTGSSSAGSVPIDVGPTPSAKLRHRRELEGAYAKCSAELTRFSEDVASQWHFPHRTRWVWPARCRHIARALCLPHCTGDIGTSLDDFRQATRLPWEHKEVSPSRHALALHLWARGVFEVSEKGGFSADFVPVVCNAVADNTEMGMAANFSDDERALLKQDISNLRGLSWS